MKIVIIQQKNTVDATTRIVTLEFESKEAVQKLIDEYLSSCPRSLTWKEYRNASQTEREKKNYDRAAWAKQQPDLQIAQVTITAEDLVFSSTYVYDLDSFFEEFKEG